MTRLRADIRLPPALAATWEQHAATLPTQTYLLVKAMREELFRRDIDVPAEPPPTQQQAAARKVAPCACGRTVEPDRECYAVPTCHVCLPPPPPLPIVYTMCRAKWAKGHRRMCNLDKGHAGQHQAGKHAWTGP